MATKDKWKCGRARSLLRLMRPLESVDPTGGALNQHEFVSEVWAVINALYGVAGVYGDQIGNEATHEVTIRDFPGIQPGWALFDVEHGQWYNIIYVDRVRHNNKSLTLWCRIRTA